MKATELMCGDIVMYNDAVWKVHTIASPGQIRLSNPMDLTELMYMNGVKPITITTEIMENNGWTLLKEVFGDIWCYEDKHVHIEIQCKHKMIVWYSLHGEFDINPVLKLPCPKYVHELQSSLRLLKLNELADNFKI